MLLQLHLFASQIRLNQKGQVWLIRYCAAVSHFQLSNFTIFFARLVKSITIYNWVTTV